MGRPNVGKSTLFNRLTKSRDAIVADFAGLTRDRHYGNARHGKLEFIVIDTGGFEPAAESGIYMEMAKQTRQAVAEADVVVADAAPRDLLGHPPRCEADRPGHVGVDPLARGHPVEEPVAGQLDVRAHPAAEVHQVHGHLVGVPLHQVPDLVDVGSTSGGGVHVHHEPGRKVVGHDPDFSAAVHDMTGAQVRLKKGGIAGIETGELLVLLRPGDLRALGGS